MWLPERRRIIRTTAGSREPLGRPHRGRYAPPRGGGDVTTQHFGAVLAEIMRRRYIAAIDIARELRVSPLLVGRWLSDEVAASAEDVAILAMLLGGDDGERLRQAAVCLPAADRKQVPAAERALCAAEQEALSQLPPRFREAFAQALGRF